MRILLTGTTGYIGKRLLIPLLEDNHEVICVVRDKRRFTINNTWIHSEKLTVWEADLQIEEQVRELPRDVDVAYYLVHSMASTSRDFTSLEQLMANNFRKYLDRSNCKQIIYLSGISNDDELSEHLESRFKTEQILAKSTVPLTVLRAAIIIGSGSASYEIIRDLVEKLPLMVAPKWVNTKCQPIAIRDTLAYLMGVALNEKTYNKSFDIGGPDILSYKNMMLGYAKMRGLKRWIIVVPILTPRLSSLWLYFVTSTNYLLARSLVDSMKNEVIVRNDKIKEIVPTEQVPYERALSLANDIIAQNAVISSWKDALASGKIKDNYFDYIQVPQNGVLYDLRQFPFDKNRLTAVLDNLWSIGGKRGWYYANFLWKLRGSLDKMLGGVGLRRGRRNAKELIVGDSLDFWRVLVADKKNKRLLLFAEMKLPGEAWLEFQIKEENNTYQLVQKATFRPRGVLGRIYWYSVFPIHLMIFPGMAKGILQYNTEKISKNSSEKGKYIAT